MHLFKGPLLTWTLATPLLACIACTTSGTEAEQGEGSETLDTSSEGSGCPGPDVAISECGDDFQCQAFDDVGSQGSPGEFGMEDGPCIWAVLRDRVPGHTYQVEQDLGDSGTTKYYLLGEDGLVMRQIALTSNGAECSTSTRELEACGLAPVSFFEDCIADPTEDCYAYDSWLSDCAKVSACPG